MTLLNIFLFIVISVYETLADSLIPDRVIGDPNGSNSTKIFLLTSCLHNVIPHRLVPIGYTNTWGVGIHKLHPEELNWNDARDECIREGAHLVVISDDKEDKLVRDAGKSIKAEQLYMGKHDQFVEGDWSTIFDEPLKQRYRNWCSNNPDNAGDGEDCGTYCVKHNGWNDVDCLKKYPFMCEVKWEPLGYIPLHERKANIETT